MSQPHIVGLNAFEPIVAFTSVARPLIEMIEGLAEDKDALPDAEKMRATLYACDALAAITDITVNSMLGVLSNYVDPTIYAEARAEFDAAQQARDPHEALAHKLNLVSRFAVNMAHENSVAEMQEGDDNTDT